MDHMIGETVLSWPAFSVTGSVAGMYNALVLSSTAVSGWGVYRLVRFLAVPRAGAFLCGFLFAFGSYRDSNLDLLNQLQTQFLPWGLYFAVRWIRKRRIRDAGGLLTCFVAQVYFGWYYTFYLALSLVLLAGYAWLAGWIRPRWSHAPPTALALALTAAAILPVTWPYLSSRATGTDLKRSLGESALYSADVIDYARWTDRSVVAANMCLPTGGQGYWPGLATVVLLVAGLIGSSKRSVRTDFSRQSALDRLRKRATLLGETGYFTFLAITSFVLSLGPLLHVAGRTLPVPLPYAAAYYLIPGVSGMRAPARLAALVTLALVVLAGMGYRSWFGRSTLPRARRIVLLALFLIAGVEAWNEPTRMVVLPRLETAAGEVRWIAAQPGDTPVLELPAPGSEAEETEVHALRQYAQLLHEKRRLDGVSGHVSDRYRSLRIQLASFPSPSVLDTLTNLGTRFVVVHYDDYPGEDARTIRALVHEAPRLQYRAKWKETVVYELGRGEARQ